MLDHRPRESLSANRIMGFNRVIELFTTYFTFQNLLGLIRIEINLD